MQEIPHPSEIMSNNEICRQMEKIRLNYLKELETYQGRSLRSDFHTVSYYIFQNNNN